MAKHKIATLREKEVIDRLAHGLVCKDIALKVFEKKSVKLASEYLEHMRTNCPEFFRLVDELEQAVPRVRKQMMRQLASHPDFAELKENGQ